MWCSLISFLLVISVNNYISLGSAASLYSPDDPLWELDSSNFKRIVFGKNNVWVVEFYSSWCGHCIRFAPEWKRFSREIQNWKNVVDVAVVNCVESENVKICRDNNVHSFPTVKLFWTNLNDTAAGEALTGPRDVLAMQQSVITYLETNWAKGVPSNWPVLQPLNVSNVRYMWDNIPDSTESVLLFLESPESFVGREVILDLSSQKHMKVRRVLSSNSNFINSLQLDTSHLTFPILLKVFRTSELEMLHRFTKDDNSTYIRDKVFDLIVGHSRLGPETIGPNKNEIIKQTSSSGVYMVDLENALHYSFHKEIGVQSDISGESLLALKNFIWVLKNYFPGNSTIMSYLSKLYNWTSHMKGNMTGEEFLSAVSRLQEEDLVLPKMREWVGCRGSSSKFRGYPCSLWTLFHSLTAQAYHTFELSPAPLTEEVMKVLPAIKGYVKYFFTCEECSDHFQMMAKDLEKEATSPRDIILWLWNAHNKVNKRLSGDATEDPSHPKIQFPSQDMCPKCRISTESSGEILWDKAMVLRYLQHYYKKESIRNEEQPITADRGNVQFDDTSAVNKFQNVSFLEKWNFQWFTSTDISLCLSLYFVSALLLVIICILFRQRRRRRRIQYAKLISIYP